MVNGVSKLKKMSKCYREVHVPAPQEINPSKRDKKKVKALESFDKNSYGWGEILLFSNSIIGCSVVEYSCSRVLPEGRFANFVGVLAKHFLFDFLKYFWKSNNLT